MMKLKSGWNIALGWTNLPHPRFSPSLGEQPTTGSLGAQTNSLLSLLGSSLKDHSSLRATLGFAEASTAIAIAFIFSLCQSWLPLSCSCCSWEHSPRSLLHKSPSQHLFQGKHTVSHWWLNAPALKWHLLLLLTAYWLKLVTYSHTNHKGASSAILPCTRKCKSEQP